MLFVYTGSDSGVVRTLAQEKLVEYTTQGFTAARIESGQFQEGQLRTAVEGVSLFGNFSAYLLDGVDEDDAFMAELLECAPALTSSDHIFIVIASTLKASEKKKLSNDAHDYTVHDRKVERFNTFALTDAFLQNDKKRLWLLLNQAYAAGVSSEEMIGVLWWQIKVLLLVTKTNSAAEADLKPYVYQKAQRAKKDFPEGRLHELATSLLSVYHEGHAGVSDIDLALERWVLRL